MNNNIYPVKIVRFNSGLNQQTPIGPQSKLFFGVPLNLL